MAPRTFSLPRPNLRPIAVLAAVSLPATASAGNGVHPRTPVVWPADTPCMTVVDRTQSPMLSMSYTIPYEDTDVTEDEVADSRRHQFIAFCRDHSRQLPPPAWLSWKDVEVAAAKSLIDPMDLTDDDVFETSTEWKDCWYRITADEMRRPITFAEAMKPVAWDTTALPAGAYVVQGYTWEPIFNIFSPRPGVVHVVDDADVASVGPAAAVTTQEDYTFADDTFMIEGCFRAMPGSTMSGYWSLTGGPTLDWVPFVEAVPLEGESFALPFNPPNEAVQETIAFRVDLTDPMQRTFTAHGVHLLTVLPGSSNETGGCGSEASFIGESCDTEGTDTDATGPTTDAASTGAGGSSGEGSDDSATTEPRQDGSGGCTCDATGSVAASWAWLILLGARRRRHACESTRRVTPAAVAP